MDIELIRNFCIIAHIDHGKSTLADRLLEATGTVSPRQMTAQFLDQMELERERGITIKSQAVRMIYQHDEQEYQLNLIDTPGHVDFSYEVSRSLTACEGALLVVDAAQGIQAQTLSNMYAALEHNLLVIPVINKIDLPSAELGRVRQELVQAFGFSEEDMLEVSAKDGAGVPALLEALVKRIPPPQGDRTRPLQALIFDSKYDKFKGVIAYLRVIHGVLSDRDRLRLMATGVDAALLELGVFLPRMEQVSSLQAGEVGYVATGLKDVRDCRVGDTITLANNCAAEPLPGHQPLKPMVFAGFYPADGGDYHALRDSLERLQLNDAALVFEPENSTALGPGFRCGFLGLLHMEIVQERLEREYSIQLVATAPSVAYRVLMHGAEEIEVDSPYALPPPQQTVEIREPWLDITMVTPSRFIGPIMELVTTSRGEFSHTEYLQTSSGLPEMKKNPSADARVLLGCHVPLAEVLWNFYDQVKSRSQGYASMDYSFAGYRAAPLVRVDVLVNNNTVDALSTIVHRDKAYTQSKSLVSKLKELIPRQLFEVPIQAVIGSRVIARETIKPLRKNVLAKCYGGDVTRKRKLLEKQAKGKKRMKRIGQVDVPQEAFLALLTTHK